MTTRRELANIWRESAQITRQGIFGSADPLRPIYPDDNRILNEQIDVPAVGMVGQTYRGDLAILSVNGAGGKFDHRPLPSSDAMYVQLRRLRDADPGETALDAFEAVNRAYVATMPDWGNQWRHIWRICEAAGSRLDEIAYLYLVPFRTRNDDGSKIPRTFLDGGYERHLARQLRAVAPKLVITIDRPSESAALRYRREVPHTEVIYYTRKRDAHPERDETLRTIASRCR
jgi:hypothetical protein